MNHLSFHYFLMRKCALIYKCFGLQACFRNELCSQSKVLLYFKWKWSPLHRPGLTRVCYCKMKVTLSFLLSYLFFPTHLWHDLGKIILILLYLSLIFCKRDHDNACHRVSQSEVTDVEHRQWLACGAAVSQPTKPSCQETIFLLSTLFLCVFQGSFHWGLEMCFVVLTQRRHLADLRTELIVRPYASLLWMMGGLLSLLSWLLFPSLAWLPPCLPPSLP